MVVGRTAKYCHFCQKYTPHEGYEEESLLFWVCLEPEHVIALLNMDTDS